MFKQFSRMGERFSPHAHDVEWAERSPYFWCTKAKGYHNKSKHTLNYSNLPLAVRHISHNDCMWIPPYPTTTDLNPYPSSEKGQDVGSFDSNKSHLLTLKDLNDLVCYLNLSKKQAELWRSWWRGGTFLVVDNRLATLEIVRSFSRILSLKMVI